MMQHQTTHSGSGSPSPDHFRADCRRFPVVRVVQFTLSGSDGDRRGLEGLAKPR
jgi:hypothetical protein